MDLAAVDKLLTTTRTVRKRLNLTRPVPREVIEQCLEMAIQAPTGRNIPRYHFVVVTDEAKRAALAALYKRAYFEVYSPQRQVEVRQSDPRLIESATYLAEHMHDVPVLIIPCVEAPLVRGTGPSAYASILPATWSLMLALRARGVGSAWTTLHLRYEQEAAALLGIPESIRQAALLPMAYYTGEDFKPAKRVIVKIYSLSRIIHQAEKSTEESPFDVRMPLRTIASQAHHNPKISTSGCPGTV
jgi:nitroreductase